MGSIARSFLLCWLLLLVHPGLAQETTADEIAQAVEPESVAAPSPRDRLLRIGVTRTAGEESFSRERMEVLRRTLLDDSDLRPRLEEAGYGSVGIFETDTEDDMLRGLNAEQFDIAFVPSSVWARQRAGYTVVLQSRRERDITSTRTRMVLQRGVVFISPRSPYFDAEIIPRDEFAEYLASARMAVVGSQSVAGFVGPLYALNAEYGITRTTGNFLWCRSNEEVVKAVLSGLADIGVTEEGDMLQVLRAAGIEEDRDEYLRVVVRSRPVPTDPVVFRAGLSPETSALGRELKQALEDHSLGGGFGGVTLQSAQDSDYIEVRLLLRDFAERIGEIRP